MDVVGVGLVVFAGGAEAKAAPARADPDKDLPGAVVLTAGAGENLALLLSGITFASDFVFTANVLGESDAW